MQPKHTADETLKAALTVYTSAQITVVARKLLKGAKARGFKMSLKEARSHAADALLEANQG